MVRTDQMSVSALQHIAHCRRCKDGYHLDEGSPLEGMNGRGTLNDQSDSAELVDDSLEVYSREHKGTWTPGIQLSNFTCGWISFAVCSASIVPGWGLVW